MNKGEIIIYQTPDGVTQLDVKVEEETVWLNRQQMSELFGRDIKTIGKHVNNAIREELHDLPVVANFAITAADGKTYNVDHYNLDVVISVGYRVKSNRGIQFRIWANRVLKEYLIKGYAINNKLQAEQLESIKNTVRLMSNVLESQSLSGDEAKGLLKVIRDYTYALDTLDRYDYQELEIENTTIDEPFRATYESAMLAIGELRDKFGSGKLFGNEKDESFKSSISTIYQTFDGEELYPSIEEKAAILLYLVVKNHSFSDGNKRIAAFLFLWFLEKNGILYRENGAQLLANNTLVALTLMIAESKPEEMDAMVKVVVNLINKCN